MISLPASRMFSLANATPITKKRNGRLTGLSGCTICSYYWTMQPIYIVPLLVEVSKQFGAKMLKYIMIQSSLCCSPSLYQVAQ